MGWFKLLSIFLPREESKMFKKLMSGRFILTIITGFIFLNLSIYGKLDAKDVMAIIIMVFTLYFTRTDRNKGE